MKIKITSSNALKLVYLLISLIMLQVFLLGLSKGIRADTGVKPNMQEVQRGKPLYETYCQSCHGVKGVGESQIPRSIRNTSYFVAPALNDSQHAWHHSDEDLVKVILEGSSRTKRMAAWKQAISKQDAIDLVAYIKSLWGSRALECQGPKHMSCM